MQICVMILTLTLCSAGIIQPENIMRPGPYRVGFLHTWEFDQSRTYVTAFDNGETYGSETSPRPILINLWYPANPKPESRMMPHSVYLDIESANLKISQFSIALKAYERSVIISELIGAEEQDLTQVQIDALDHVLQSDSGCYFDAQPLEEEFPLIVYHAGAGSSFEDNALMCTYLASHGYVVIGSAFQAADGSSLNIDGNEGSIGDINFIVNWAKQFPFVNGDKIALLGHSAGAQAIMKYGATPNAVHDVLVVLDTTQDYVSYSVPLHQPFIENIKSGIDELDEPMLIATGSEAIFTLCDTLSHSNRTYFTIKHLDHNEFISQGFQSKAVKREINVLEPINTEQVDKVLIDYAALYDYVRTYLDSHLKGNIKALLSKNRSYIGTALGGDLPYVTLVPVGIIGPPTYDPSSSNPPTPRQIVRVLKDSGVDQLCVLLERFKNHKPTPPIYNSTMLTGSLLFELIAVDRFDDARRLHDCFKNLQIRTISFFIFVADFNILLKRIDSARIALSAALVLEPENSKISEKLRSLNK